MRIDLSIQPKINGMAETNIHNRYVYGCIALLYTLAIDTRPLNGIQNN